MLIIKSFLLFFFWISNLFSWWINTVVFRLISLKKYKAIIRKRNEIGKKLIHMFKLLSKYFNNLLHHLELLIYGLRKEIHRSMRMIYWYLFIIRLLKSRHTPLLVTLIVSIKTRLISSWPSWNTVIAWSWRLADLSWLLTFYITRISFLIFLSLLNLFLSL